MTSFNPIYTFDAPAPIGCYSQAISIGDFVFLSGQLGLNPKTMEMVSGGCEAQIDQIFQNMKAVIKAAGGGFANIVKLTIYLRDLKDFPLVNEKMKAYFKEPYPARTTIEVSGLPKGALVEIEAICAT